MRGEPHRNEGVAPIKLGLIKAVVFIIFCANLVRVNRAFIIPLFLTGANDRLNNPG